MVASDPLWQKAVDLAALNRDRVPGLLDMTSKVMDKKGKVEDLQEIKTRLFLGETGEVESELVRIVANGEDITEKTRADMEKRDQGKKDENSGEVTMEFQTAGIFDPASQDRLTTRSTGQKAFVDGHSCIGYTFSFKEKDGTVLSGTAWLEEGTGIPMEVQSTPDPLPKHVKSMKTTLKYEVQNNRWGLREMVVEGVGGMLFIKKKFHMTTTFSDWFEAPTSTP